MENATLAFADTIPDDLCAACDAMEESDYGSNRVVHYNDAHCPSGDMLQAMLAFAADRAMDRAAEKRSLVGGRLSASV